MFRWFPSVIIEGKVCDAQQCICSVRPAQSKWPREPSLFREQPKRSFRRRRVVPPPTGVAHNRRRSLRFRVHWSAQVVKWNISLSRCSTKTIKITTERDHQILHLVVFTVSRQLLHPPQSNNVNIDIVFRYWLRKLICRLNFNTKILY